MQVYSVADPNKTREPDVSLPSDAQALFNRLWAVWNDRRAENAVKVAYYNAEQPVKNLNITIPPGMANRVQSRCDWARMAVDYLANRSVFEGFAFADSDNENEAVIDEIVAGNDLPDIYDGATRAELICSPAFLTVSAGFAGEPQAVIRAYSATESAALWNERKRRVEAAFTVVSSDDRGEPDAYNLYTEDAVVEVWKVDGFWKYKEHPHNHGRPLIEPLRYRWDTWAPFGHSRVSKTVRDLVDAARANEIYTAVASEFYSAPQRYLLGADEDIFEGTTKWEAYIGNIFAVTRDENGNVPTYGQLPQMTLEPLLARRRDLAKQLSGVTGVPMQSLGVVSDSNPTSYEAMHMAENDIVIEAEHLNRSNGQAMANVARLALAIAKGKPVTQLDATESSVFSVFANPQRPSLSQRSDFAMKTASIYPAYVETSVFKEDMGWDAATRQRLENEEKLINGRRTLQGIIGND